jgi:hypothetical protein
MLARFVLAVLFALGIGLHAGAADLSAIPRTILKEPTYQGKPRYCLLVFGKDAKTRIWMVRDDQSVYVDRNSNGDLTEPAEKHPSPGGFSLGDIGAPDGVRKNLSVYTMADGTFRMNFGQRGAGGQYVGIGQMERPRWGDKAENAPIIHFDGPMTLGRYGAPVTIPRDGGTNRRFSLRLLVGTPGLGSGTFASYDEICARNFGPLHADIVYGDARKKGATFTQHTELVHDG